MFPFLIPEKQPFPLPKNKGDIFEDSFGAEANGNPPLEWIDKAAGHTVNNGGLITPNDATVRVLQSSFWAKDVAVSCAYKRLTADNNFVIIAVRWDGSLSGGAINNAYTLTVHDVSGILLRKVVGGTTTVLAQNTSLVGNYSRFGTMGLCVEGNRLRGYYTPLYSADPKMLFDVVDSAIPTAGYMGIQTRAGTYDFIKAVRI